MNHFILLPVFLAAFLLPHAAHANCIYSPTECQCTNAPAGNPCLRYAAGAGASMTCEVYACNSGYICDCGGTEICDVSDCTATRDVYRPVDSNPLTVGTTVSCGLATQVTCVTPRPSVSSTPSATPSASTVPPGAPAPSASTTPSATPSNSPPAVLPQGAACTATDTCASGTQCGCLGTCDKIVTVEVTGLGDDSLRPWMCSNAFGPATTGFRETGTWSYTGPCSDLYLEVNNAKGGHTGFVAALKEGGTTSWTPLVLSGGLTSITAYNPTPGFMSDPSYDFTSWYPPVQQTSSLSSDSYYINFQNTYGSDAMTYLDGHLGSSATTTFYSSYYKVTLPFC